jgi:hypothetical protein
MQETIFHFVRDYETVKVEQEVPNEFLLVLYDGDDETSWHPDRKTKAMGAYYKNIERKMYLKKKRANVSIILQIRNVSSHCNINSCMTIMKISGKSFVLCMHQ